MHRCLRTELAVLRRGAAAAAAATAGARAPVRQAPAAAAAVWPRQSRGLLVGAQPLRAPVDDGAPTTTEARSAPTSDADKESEASAAFAAAIEEQPKSSPADPRADPPEPHNDRAFQADSKLHLWPYLSKAEATIGPATAGEGFPFVPRLNDDEACLEALYHEDTDAEIDLALLANALPRLGQERGSEALELLLEKLSPTATIDSKCSVEVLASVVTGLGAVIPNERCEPLLGKATNELLNRRDKRFRHVLPLVRLLGLRDSAVKPVVPERLAIRQATEAFAVEEGSTVDFSELAACYEALARVRDNTAEAELDAAVGELAAALAPSLKSGYGLRYQLAVARSDADRADVLRLLAALWSLPEVARVSGVACALASVRSVRWPKRLPGVDERTAAAAGCTIARAGAWDSAVGGFLLGRALARRRLTPEAGALWLCAIGQSGRPLDGATDKPDKTLAGVAEEHLMASVDALLAAPAEAGERRALALTQALWGMCALKKEDKRADLLKALAELPAAQFPTAVWGMLLEVKHSMVSEDNAVEEFQAEAWQQGLESAASAQAAALAASGRCEELKAAAAELAAGGEVGEIELAVDLGPYSGALRAAVGESTVILDFDGLESPVSRALRRQQWEALAPGVRVEEVPLSSWDAWDGAARAEVVRRRLLGIEEEADDDED